MASAILPKTSTRTGPKSFDIRSRELNAVRLNKAYRGKIAHPQSMYSMHIMTSPELCKKAPKNLTMFGELQSCMM